MNSFRRTGFAVILLCAVLGAGCGDTFRPIAFTVDPQPSPDPQARRHALVVNNAHGAQGTVSYINVSGDTNVLNAPVGAGPVHISLSPDTVRFFVSNRDDDSVTMLVTTVFGASPTTVTLPAGSAPRFTFASNQSAFVALTGVNAVGVIPYASLALTEQVPVGNSPVVVVGVPGGNKVYSVNQGDNTVTPVRVGDLQAEAPIPVGNSPVWAAMNNEGAFLYVLNQGSQSVSVINTATDAVIATLPVGPAPESLYFDRRLRRLYVPNTGGNTVHVFKADVAVPELLNVVTVGLGPRSVVALEDGLRAYVANSGSNTVSVIRTGDNVVIATIDVDAGPAWIDASPDFTKVYTANRDGDSISIIRPSDNTVTSTLPSGSPRPVFVLVTP